MVSDYRTNIYEKLPVRLIIIKNIFCFHTNQMETPFAPMQTLTQSREPPSSSPSPAFKQRREKSLKWLGALAAPIILLTMISQWESGSAGLVRGARAAEQTTQAQLLVCPRGFFLKEDDQTCKRKYMSFAIHLHHHLTCLFACE